MTVKERAIGREREQTGREHVIDRDRKKESQCDRGRQTKIDKERMKHTEGQRDL